MLLEFFGVLVLTYVSLVIFQLAHKEDLEDMV